MPRQSHVHHTPTIPCICNNSRDVANKTYFPFVNSSCSRNLPLSTRKSVDLPVIYWVFAVCIHGSDTPTGLYKFISWVEIWRRTNTSPCRNTKGWKVLDRSTSQLHISVKFSHKNTTETIFCKCHDQSIRIKAGPASATHAADNVFLVSEIRLAQEGQVRLATISEPRRRNWNRRSLTIVPGLTLPRPWTFFSRVGLIDYGGDEDSAQTHGSMRAVSG